MMVNICWFIIFVFFGGDINICGMKNVYYRLFIVFVFCFERCWFVIDANVYFNVWNIVYSNRGESVDVI